MRRARRHAVDRLPDVAAVVLALLVCAPLLGRGYVLSYDMVWVPHLSLARLDVWGLGSALPRAVPSDALVALAGTVVPQWLVQRLVLVGTLVAAGAAASRLSAPLPTAGRLAATVLAVWNPFVAERLALGSWPVLVGYAGAWWLLVGLRRRRHLATVLGLAATAVSPATGLMGLLVVLVATPGRLSRRLGWLALGVALNAPWLVSGLLHGTSSVVDPGSVRLFDAQPELHLGRLGAVLSLGGIWNTEVVPTSRTLLSSTLLVLASWAVMLLGVRAWWRRGRDGLAALAVLAGVGVVVSLLGSAAPDLLADVVEHVPGTGLLRDGTRWLLLLAPLQVVAFAHGVAWLADRCRDRSTRRLVAAGLALVPLAALPDLAWGVAGQLHTTRYPDDWQAARTVVAQHDGPGDVLVLPFTSYRAPLWNHARPVLDPLGRLLDRDTVVSDDLYVSGRRIAGEDPRAAKVARTLAGEWTDRDLAALGIGLVVLDPTAPGAADLPASGLATLTPLHGTDDGLHVYAVDGARERDVPASWRVLVPAAWTAAALALAGGIALPGVHALRRRRSTRR